MLTFACFKLGRSAAARLGSLALLLLAGGLATANANEWPHWRGPDYNGISKETGWSIDWTAEGPKVLWKHRVGIGYSSFAVANGRAYTMGHAGKSKDQETVFCFDAATGNEVWRHGYEEKLGAKYYDGGPSATPTVAGDRVYTLSKTGKLHCLGAADGKVIWMKSLPDEVAHKIGKPAKLPEWGFAGSVLARGDRLFANVGTLGTALDMNGNILWTTGPEASGYSTMVPVQFEGKEAVAVFGGQAVAALDPVTGAVLWSHEWKTMYDVNAADPIVRGDLVFVSSGYNRGASTLRVRGKALTPLWES
jgi:outer membrane protein assembly factor BamB